MMRYEAILLYTYLPLPHVTLDLGARPLILAIKVVEANIGMRHRTQTASTGRANLIVRHPPPLLLAGADL